MATDRAFDPAEYERLLRFFDVDQYRRRGRPESRSLVAYRVLRAEQDRAFSRRMAETAEKLAAEGRAREAVEEFSRAIGFCETAEALLGRAAVCLSLRNFDRCTADYNRVLEIDPGNQEALRYFGSIRQSNAASLRSMPERSGCREAAQRAAWRGDEADVGQGGGLERSKSESDQSTPSHRHRKRKKEKKHKKKKKKVRTSKDDRRPEDGS